MAEITNREEAIAAFEAGQIDDEQLTKIKRSIANANALKNKSETPEIKDMKGANEALNAGKITQDEFDTYQQKFAIKTSDTNAIATGMGLPSGSPLLAGTGIDVVGGVLGTVAPTGQYSKDVSTTTPTFPAASNATLDTKKALEGDADVMGSVKASQEATGRIGETTKNILEQPALDAEKAATDVIAENKKSFNDIRSANQNALGALDEAHKAIKTAADKAVIDPWRYVKELGVGRIVALGIIAFLGGGKAVASTIARNTEIDIEAQKQTFLNLSDIPKQYEELAKKGVDIAAVNAAARSAAAISVLSGASALVTHAMTTVQSQTAKDRATVIQGAMENEMMTQQMKFDELRKGLVTTGDAATLNLIGEMMRRIGMAPNTQPVPLRQDQQGGAKTYQAPITDVPQKANSAIQTATENTKEFLNKSTEKLKGVKDYINAIREKNAARDMSKEPEDTPAFGGFKGL
jgi:hypothetical protein